MEEVTERQRNIESGGQSKNGFCLVKRTAGLPPAIIPLKGRISRYKIEALLVSLYCTINAL